MPAWLSLYAPIAENKKGIYKFSARFLAFSDKISTVQKKCCPRAEDRAIFEDLRLRGQGQGLEASRPRTSKCVLEDVLEAKDVLEDSTSDNYASFIFKQFGSKYPSLKKLTIPDSQLAYLQKQLKKEISTNEQSSGPGSWSSDKRSSLDREV